MTNKNYLYEETHTVQEKEITTFRIPNDVNGNPRYVVHFMDLDIKLADYDKINKLYDFNKYRAKWFGGGVVFQSYNIEDTLNFALNYDVTLDELKELNNYFKIQDSIALNNAIMLDEEKLYKNSDVSTILFNNYIIEVLEDLNNMLSDVK